MELATYVKGMSKHTNADVLDGCFSGQGDLCAISPIFFAWEIGWQLELFLLLRKEAQLPVMIPKCLQDLLAVLPSRPRHPWFLFDPYRDFV